jgi:hypothetical protein
MADQPAAPDTSDMPPLPISEPKPWQTMRTALIRSAMAGGASGAVGGAILGTMLGIVLFPKSVDDIVMSAIDKAFILGLAGALCGALIGLSGWCINLLRGK